MSAQNLVRRDFFDRSYLDPLRAKYIFSIELETRFAVFHSFMSQPVSGGTPSSHLQEQSRISNYAMKSRSSNLWSVWLIQYHSSTSELPHQQTGAFAPAANCTPATAHSRARDRVDLFLRQLFLSAFTRITGISSFRGKTVFQQCFHGISRLGTFGVSIWNSRRGNLEARRNFRQEQNRDISSHWCFIAIQEWVKYVAANICLAL